jgi:hypothetical protein
MGDVKKTLDTVLTLGAKIGHKYLHQKKPSSTPSSHFFISCPDDYHYATEEILLQPAFTFVDSYKLSKTFRAVCP